MRPRLGVLTAAALLPAGVLVIDPAGLSPFGPAKWAAVSTLASIGAVVAIGRRPVWALRRAVLAWAALLVALAGAAALGADRLYAWTGTPERNFGVLTWVLCAAAFLVGQSLDDVDDARWVVAVAVATAGAMGAWATAEALGWRAVPVAESSGRVLGPLGSAAFLGAASALLLPVALACSFDRSWSVRSRRLAGIAAVLCGVGLVGAGARAAWFGVGVAGLVAALLHRHWLMANRGAVVPVAAAAVVALLATGGALGMGSRLFETFDGRAAGGASRLDEWRVAARVLAHHPLGVGPEGYRVVFAEGVDASYEREHGRQILPDRAHDVLLDVGLAAGLPGLAIYLALLAIVGRQLLRALGKGPMWVAGAAAGLVAYGAQELFLFPVASLEPAAWLLAGLVVAHVASPAELRRFTPPRPAVMLVGALGAVAIVAGAGDILADRQARLALVDLDRGRIVGAERHADRAVGLRPDVIRYRLAAERAHAASATVEGDAEALQNLDRALALSPGDPVVKGEKAAFLLALARRTLAPADLARAGAYLREVVADDPRNAELQLRLGVASALAADEARAEAAWRAAASLAPRSDAAPTNLAELYARQGRWVEARLWAERALARGPGGERARAIIEQAAEHGT